MAKHTFPPSAFEDEHGLGDGPTVYPDDASDADVRDPDYGDVYNDGDGDDGGSQEWRYRPQK